MSKLTYIRCGDYDIPNLKLSEQPETSIGKYGRMRKSYLKEHRSILYNHLLMSEKLYPHLLEIERRTQGRVETMLPHISYNINTGKMQVNSQEKGGNYVTVQP